MQLIRLLAIPFLPIYAFFTWLRNRAYDSGIIRSNQFDIPVISVGNLSVGGTGKTPHVEYLIRLLKKEFKVGVVSRGYGRVTNEYLEVQPDMTAREVGDEPLQVKRKFRDSVVFAVEKQRILGITRLVMNHQETDVVLLDDAFQHRSVRAGVNILLTTHGKPFSDDFLLPVGDLRELRTGRKRADIVIITKCPENLSEDDKLRISNKLKVEVPVFFSRITYGEFRDTNASEVRIDNLKKTVVVTGIAKPELLHDELDIRGINYEKLVYPDHYRFKRRDIDKIVELFGNFEASQLITTEKDLTRLLPFTDVFESRGIQLTYLEIEAQFIGADGEQFNELITNYVRANKDNHRIPEEQDEL